MNARELLEAHGFETVDLVLADVEDAIKEDLSFTLRESVANSLWGMGGWIKHKGCRNNPKHGNDADYENGCDTCETYLLAIADALLAIKRATK